MMNAGHIGRKSMHTSPPERISVDVTNRCDKGCSFCYNKSNDLEADHWGVDELIAFLSDCAGHGTKAVSLGGGEPLLWPGVAEVIKSLKNVLLRSFTTSGIPFSDESLFHRLIKSAPDKIQFSIHQHEEKQEVERVIGQVKRVERNGIRSGINLLVSSENFYTIRLLTRQLISHGLTPSQLTYVPRRFSFEPTPEQVAFAAGFYPFQSSGCLTGCNPGSRFCSVSFDKKVHWCSFSHHKQPLETIDATGLTNALAIVGAPNCRG